jgi:AcrR family transcriptional regulator
MPKKIHLRRAPKQQRGQQRLDCLLDAAALEFGRVGFEAATTNAIARRARTSVGSLYQFFPNKEAILYALTDRYLAKLRAVHEIVHSPEAARLPPAAFFDRLINTLVEFHRAEPGFRSLFYGSQTSPHVAAAAARLHQECIGRAETAIGARAPHLDAARRRLYATINVEVVKALLPLAESGDEAFRAEVLAQIKILLLRYMQPVMGDGNGADRRGGDSR